MKTALLDYELPSELIALRPPTDRDAGRLLTVERDGLRHGWVRDWVDGLSPGDLLVLNDTKVRKARLFCQRPRVAEGGGGKVELLFLHAVSEDTWAALGRAARALRAGDQLLAPGLELEVVERDADGLLRVFVKGELERVLEQHGAMPIPPYLDRPADEGDDARYQTVFAKHLGSAAAPTAGLHVTTEMLERVQAKGVQLAHVTLHVGVGTFRPVVAEDLDQHLMHSEDISVPPEVAAAVAQTRERGGRVVAVGTTVVRALESARDPAHPGLVLPMTTATRLLIQPGYCFSVVDALLTNFHQPKSTLLALVAAFAGYERIKEAYRTAVQQRYRFLSYGDAMWIPSRLGQEEP